MPKKLFAIVGYTNHGKSNTLYELFDRRQFFPLKSPIIAPRFGSLSFTVINASNEDRPTQDYLNRLQGVLEHHQDSDTIFVITISLIFDNARHDANAVFDYLNSLSDVDIHYLVLDHGWFAGKSLTRADIDAMQQLVEPGRIHRFGEVINTSKTAFTNRTNNIARKITELLAVDALTT